MTGSISPPLPPPPWWQAAFGPDYELVYAHRSDDAATAEIAGLLPHLGSGPVLDACCGNGRHLAALQRAGITAVGFDYSANLLRSAATRAEASGRVSRADVRAIPFAGNFSAVLVLFTAFGYFDEADNGVALAALAGQLAAGGSLVLDLPDPQRVYASLVRESSKTVAGLTIREQRRIEGQRVVKDVHISRPDGSLHTYTESVRLYAADEIGRLATSVGLRVNACWSSLRDAAIDEGRQVWWLG